MSISFSFIIPVLNEQFFINQTINHIRKLGSNFDYEIIVVDGDPLMNTINLINDNDVIKIIADTGRAKQMNEGANIAKKDILIFLHADTELPDNALHEITNIVLNKNSLCGAFELGIKSERYIFRLIEKIVLIRTRLTKIPYGDQAIFIKKELFYKLKGYKDIPLMEDVELMWRIKKLGEKIHIIPYKVKTSSRRWDKEGVIYCTLRNWFLISLFLLGLPPEKFVKLYYKQYKI